MPLESELENKAVMRARQLDILTLKLNVKGRTGWPDRIFIFKGIIHFVEFKAPGGALSPMQCYIHEALRKHGVNVVVLDNWEETNGFLERMCSASH